MCSQIGLHVLTGLMWYSDSAATLENFCEGSGCFFSSYPMKIYFIPVMFIAMIATCTFKSFPKTVPDLPAAVLLIVFQTTTSFMGCFAAIYVYSNFGDAAGGSTLAAQIGIGAYSKLLLFVCVALPTG